MEKNSTQNMSSSRVVLLAILFAAGGFVVWILLSGVIWYVFGLLGRHPGYLPILTSVSAAGGVAQIFGGGVVLLRQMRDSADSRNLGIYNHIFEKLMSNENIEARRWIYLNLPDDPQIGIDGLSPEGQRHVKNVLNSLDHLGFLMEQDWITAEGEQAIIKWVSPFVVKVWARLEPYISYEGQRRHEPDYYDSIRQLAERCIAWRKANLPDAGIVWLKKAL